MIVMGSRRWRWRRAREDAIERASIEIGRVPMAVESWEYSRPYGCHT